MKTQKEKVELRKLKFDDKLLSLRKVNPYFVSRYRQAYRNGANMPAIVTDQDYKVVSGNHRLSALNEEYPAKTKVTIEKRYYNSEAEILKDFTRENTSHGNPLDGYTRKKLIAELMNNDVNEYEIAKMFNISVNRIEKLGEEFFTVKIGDSKPKPRPKQKTKESQNINTNLKSEPKTEPKTVLKPGKNDVNTNKTISMKLWEEQDRNYRGVYVTAQCGELIHRLNNDMVKKTDANMKALRQLQDALKSYFNEKK